MIPPCLTLSNIRYILRLKWSNPGKGIASSPTPPCSSYWKGSLLVTFDYNRQLYFFTYIYIYIYIGVCVRVCVCVFLNFNDSLQWNDRNSFFSRKSFVIYVFIYYILVLCFVFPFSIKICLQQPLNCILWTYIIINCKYMECCISQPNIIWLFYISQYYV